MVSASGSQTEACRRWRSTSVVLSVGIKPCASVVIRPFLPDAPRRYRTAAPRRERGDHPLAQIRPLG